MHSPSLPNISALERYIQKRNRIIRVEVPWKAHLWMKDIHFPYMHLVFHSQQLPPPSFPDAITQNQLLSRAPFRSFILYLTHFHQSCGDKWGVPEELCMGEKEEESTCSLLVASAPLSLCTLKVYRFCKVFSGREVMHFSYKKFTYLRKYILKPLYLFSRLLGERSK